mmetsp:Transcript_12149/g.50385  ORF Transcript_12149/g.50385 Transcript_12149/m.50385 type:complete len:355 (-) Transcript_12149:410-1474(-)|eukprot:CAMPEP_0113968484 /NCGR_PEP_ID=MMETSP0011_2-20120614/9571_1 /TAXON_ID=101924 /ORGANISM="Rhodosorus marinus" /LENGTH=354 /DNA_ID=CAMNT_0000981603 /DNA_START=126 /DNA_END=1190 /DNA_ORIENTATION=+ /assembly_acc=CAM_ASM_000156
MMDRLEQAKLLEDLLPENGHPKVHEDAHMDMSSADYYFNSYAHFGIHEEMLRDEVRTESYMRAILDNAACFSGKAVLDVGCGTGILSMFAARAGARAVYAVDCSKIVDQAREIVRKNGMENVVTVIEGKMEEIELPEKVDIIISEWMGYFLFYESMLDTVIYARDRFLKPGGLLFPNETKLYICGIEDGKYKSYKYDFWGDVYGVDMSHIKNIALTEPLVDIVNPEQVSTDRVELLTVDISTVKKEDLACVSPFRVKSWRADSCHALVCYFDVTFSAGDHTVYFTTAPQSKSTHWKQTVFYLDESIYMEAGEELSGVLALRPSKKNPRDLDIAIQYSFEGKHSAAGNTLRYRLS